MTAPEPTGEHAPSLAERVARARQRIAHEGTGYVPPWQGLTAHEQVASTQEAANWLRAAEVAGLAVVELPETLVLDGQESGIPEDLGREVSAPPSDGKGYSVMGVERPGGAYVELPGIGWRDLDYAERDALRILAVVAELRRLQAEHQGGDPR